MAPLATVSSTLVRCCVRQQLPAVRAAVASSQQRDVTQAAKSSFESPFSRTKESSSTLKIPSFGKYASKSSAQSNKVFAYFAAGSLGLISAVGGKNTVQGAWPGVQKYIYSMGRKIKLLVYHCPIWNYNRDSVAF